MKIKEVKAEIIKNSRGENTIQITINKKYKASAPSGASVGSCEVKPFPKAGVPVGLINRNLSKALKGLSVGDFKDLKKVEYILFDYDQSKNLKKIGGNTVIAIEYALLRAMSRNNVWSFLNSYADELPVPLGNCIGGGAHYLGKSTDIQEFLLMPVAETFREAVFANEYVYKKIGNILRTPRTDEGAWTSMLSHERVLALLEMVKKDAEKKFGLQMFLGIDVAASQLYKDGYYHWKDSKLNKSKHLKKLNGLIDHFNLEYVEDGLEENDFEGFKKIKCDLNCGDDLVCTQLDRLEKARRKINCVVIKPNQIGSLIKTKQVINCAKKHHIKCVISHRSGETNDSMISDLAVGWDLPYIKCGIFGKERKSKIDRLIAIEKKLL